MIKNESLKIIKGNFIFTETPEAFSVHKNSYIILKSGTVYGLFNEIPKEYKHAEIIDFGDSLIIPGMNDMHCHAAQFANLGIGMDKELLPWLNDYTFPEESKLADLSYAINIYERFIKNLWKNGTTRSAVYASLHLEATKLLGKMFIASGLGALIGKVNMDSNCPPGLVESTEASLKTTEAYICGLIGKSTLVKPIITPRFIPTCSNDLLEGLSTLSKKYDLPVQSHLSENLKEIEFVQKIHPECEFYGRVYDKYDLFGTKPTLMAHCIHSSDEEISLLKQNNVTVVHCPTSNLNLSSGIMQVRKFFNAGINVTLGSDISGGHTLSMFKVISSAVQVSKIKWMESDKLDAFLSLSEAFYMATKAAGHFFEKTGSFEKGYSFDALIIDDSNLYPDDYSLIQRIERLIYIGDDRNIFKRFVNGCELVEPSFDKNNLLKY